MAEVFDFSKGKAALEARKARASSMKAPTKTFRQGILEEIRQDVATHGIDAVLGASGKNILSVYEKMKETFGVTTEFTSPEALNVMKNYFDALFDSVGDADFDDEALKNETIKKLDEIIARTEGLKKEHHVDRENKTHRETKGNKEAKENKKAKEIRSNKEDT